MAKEKLLNPDHFLNRLALDYNCNPADLRMRKVLREIYWFARPEDYMEMLDDFFTAAMDSNSVWKEGKKGTAGNSIFVLEQIEMIIEGTYLLYVKWKRKAEKTEKKKQDPGHVIPAHLPLLLSEEECRQPMLVVKRFFKYLPLPAWKKLLRDFAISSLGDGSVTEMIEQQQLFPFTKYLRKLIWAGFLLSAKP